MEWRQKATFQEILEEKIQANTQDFYSQDPFFAILQAPKVEIKSHSYPHKKLDVEARITAYVQSWTKEKQELWDEWQSLAKTYSLTVYPWEIKNAFRKLAKKVHPDVNQSPKAKGDFRRLYSIYKELV